MRREGVLLAAVLAIAPAGGVAGSEPAAAGAVVTIRSARLVEVPTGDAALEIVRSIFRESGIEIVWRECASGRAGGAADACDDRLARTEVVVRFVAAPATAPRESLGFSYVTSGAGIGRLASVYPARVARLAEGAALSQPALLGRVIAHEVGHLLLGTTDHSREGLMRARWSTLDLARQPSAQAWGFSREEAAAMRRSLGAGLAVARAW